MQFQNIRKLGSLSLAVAALGLSERTEAQAQTAPIGAKPPPALVAKAAPAIDIKSFSQVTIEAKGSPSTVSGALAALKSADSRSELRSGIATFAIMREGSPLKYEYPPKNLTVNTGDVIVRFNGFDQKQLARIFATAAKDPNAAEVAKFKENLAKVFATNQVDQLKQVKGELDVQIHSSLKALGLDAKPHIVTVKSGQHLRGIVEAAVPASLKNQRQSQRIGFIRTLSSITTEEFNNGIDPANLKVGQKLNIPNFTGLTKNSDPHGAVTALDDKLEKRRVISQKLAELNPKQK